MNKKYIRITWTKKAERSQEWSISTFIKKKTIFKVGSYECYTL